MKLRSLRVNSNRAVQGDWIDKIPGMDDLRLKVRGFSNPDYKAFLSKEVAAVPRDQRVDGRANGAPLPKVREAILAKAMVEHILLDWGNLTGDDDKPMPYSKEKAAELLANPDYRPLVDAIGWAANELDEGSGDKVEAVAGNSATASGGTSAGDPSAKRSAA